MALFKLLACMLVVTLVSSADEGVARKKVVSVGANNASLVVDKIRHNATASVTDRQRFLLALYHAGKPAETLKYYESLDAQSVTKSERMIYVRCLLDVGRPRDAYIQLKVVDNPKNPDLNVELMRAKLLIRLKEWKAARSILQMVIRIAPDNPEAHYYYALTCPTVGDYEGTIKHCNRVWELVEPNSKMARLAGALMLVSLDKRKAGAEQK